MATVMNISQTLRIITMKIKTRVYQNVFYCTYPCSGSAFQARKLCFRCVLLSLLIFFE